MTNEQAIKIIKKYDALECGYCHQGGEEIEEAFDMAIQALQADRGLNEWCHDCKEYDQEKHCCPRFNRVIRETLAEVQADGEYILKDTAIDDITTGLCEGVSCEECPFDIPDAICKVSIWLEQLSSVAIPTNAGLIGAILSVIDSSDFPEDKVHRIELMIRGEQDE